MQIYFRELTLDEGFEVMKKDQNRLVAGREVSRCSGWKLFSSLEGQPIKCWECGAQADRWISEKGSRDKIGKPVLNLYGVNPAGRLVLITRDHIIPKSLGGLDLIENLRPACELCNGARGNEVTGEDIQFRLNNPHLISQQRLEDGRHGARRAWYRPGIPEWERQKAVAPFIALDPDYMKWVLANPIHKAEYKLPHVQQQKKPKVATERAANTH